MKHGQRQERSRAKPQRAQRKPFCLDLDFMNKGLAFLGELCAFARKLTLFWLYF
jgi:hypothetical protein